MPDRAEPCPLLVTELDVLDGGLPADGTVMTFGRSDRDMEGISTTVGVEWGHRRRAVLAR